jgi:hypothetical protein
MFMWRRQNSDTGTRAKSLKDNLNKYCGGEAVDWNSDNTFLY